MKYEPGLSVRRTIAVLTILVSGCASGPPPMPYPAFIVVDELPNIFIAGLPGARAKQLAGDPRTRRSSNRVLLPADWQFTTGASPGLSVEMFVLAGEVRLGEFLLQPGGYAYIPAGSTGMTMKSDNGALLLYFVDEADPQAVIQTPLITNSELLDWQPLSDDVADFGLSTREFRLDPGSGARAWLLRVEPGAMQSWQKWSDVAEGYLLSGRLMQSECVNGEVVTAEYLPGGYFLRPPGAIHGGPETGTETGAVWFIRTPRRTQVDNVEICAPEPDRGG